MASSQTKVVLKVGGNTLTAILTDNEATRELTKLLEQGDITIRLSDYGGFEKVGALPQSLPTSNTQIASSHNAGRDAALERNSCIQLTFLASRLSCLSISSRTASVATKPNTTAASSMTYKITGI